MAGVIDVVILMTNDSVAVYDISEPDFDELLSKDFLTKNDARLEHHKVYEILKAGYTSLKLQQQLGDMLNGIDAYYYDNGSFICKKDITSIDEVQYYEDENGGLWASQEYEQAMHSGVKISLKQAELTSLDNRLNRYSHIQNLLPPSLIEEFKRLYDGEAFIQARRAQFSHCDSPYVINSFYEVPSVSKLIVRNNNKKLTAALLDGNVFLTVAKAGINDAGETKYFVQEYRITKQDIPEINKMFRKYLKEDKLKVDDLTDDERFLYLDRSVREYRKKLINELNGVSAKERTIVSDTTWTWNAYKAAFLAKYGYTVPSLDDSWAPFDQTTIDARTIHNGYIMPITIENYQRDASSLKTNVVRTNNPVITSRPQEVRRFIANTGDTSDIPKVYPRDYSLLNYPSIEEYLVIEDEDKSLAPQPVAHPTSSSDTLKEEVVTPTNTNQAPTKTLPKYSYRSSDIADLILQVDSNFRVIKADLAELREDFAPHFYEEVFKIDSGYPAEFISTVQGTLTDVSTIAENVTNHYNSFLVTVDQVSKTNFPFAFQKLQNMLNITSRIIEDLKKQKARVAFIKEIIMEKASSKEDDSNEAPSLEDVKYSGAISHLEGDEFVRSSTGTDKSIKKQLEM